MNAGYADLLSQNTLDSILYPVLHPHKPTWHRPSGDVVRWAFHQQNLQLPVNNGHDGTRVKGNASLRYEKLKGQGWAQPLN